MSKDKIKLLTLGDHCLFPSGVAHQSRIMCEHLLETGDYEIVSLGGAREHDTYQPTQTDKYGDDWTIYPVDGYGNPDIIRSSLRSEKPDIFWFMTDPRFYEWLWQMEDEIRGHCPMVYYHVWDNYPVPEFNKNFYDSTDVIVSISELTQDIVSKVASDEVDQYFLPHTVDTRIFRGMPDSRIEDFKKESFGDDVDDKFIFLFNSRNARRKQTGSLIFAFKKFLDKVGHDNGKLIMHTDPNDENGQDLNEIIKKLDLTDGEVVFSQEKVSQEMLAMLYNSVDCVCQPSDAEGFGLSVLEGKACETPSIVTETGGLQDQITNGEETFGIGIEPSSSLVIGSQNVPYIYEDRISMDDLVDAMVEMYEMGEDEREMMGKKARQDVLQRFNYNDFCDKWDMIFKETYDKYGSWPVESYDSWTLDKVA